MLTKLGFKVVKEDRSVKITGNMASLMRLVSLEKEVLFKGVKRKENKSKLESSFYEDRPDFYGGSFENVKTSLLTGKVNLKPYEEALATNTIAKLVRKTLEETLTPLPKRKRTLSEHDGEW